MAKAEYRSSIRSRKLICSALADLLQEKPLEKITITDVVTRANLNRGTFYAHYTSITDVINCIVENACSSLREALHQYPAGEHPDPEFLLTQVQAFLEEDPELYRKIFTSDISASIIEKLRKIFLDYMMENEENFRKCDHDYYVFSILFGSGGVIMMYRDWFTGQLSCSLPELTQKTIEILHKILYITDIE